MISFPVELLTGAVHDPAAVQRGFTEQIVWLVLWYAAYRLAWSRGVKQYGAVGG
jgi:ABC-type uncharacterized transport system permease subunit